MKKIIATILILLMFIVALPNKMADAGVNDYTSFSILNVSDGKLLRDYTSDEINTGLSHIKKRKFNGWRYELFQKNTKVDFISNTVFTMYNSGTTPMKYKVHVSSEHSVKTSISCTGSIKYGVSGSIKKFKNDLDSCLKIEGSYVETQLVKQEENLEVEIDPGTICVVYIQGTGLLTNGVASFYQLWMRKQSGGFEYFTITDSYLRIEKIKL